MMRATKPIPNPAVPKELEMKPADAAAVVAGRWSPARPARRPWEAQSPPRVEAGRDVGADAGRAPVAEAERQAHGVRV